MSTMDEKCQSSTSKLSAKTVVKADISKTSRKRKYSNESVVRNKRINIVKSVTEQKVSQGNVQKMEEQGENKKLTALSHDCKPSTSKASRKTVGIADVAKTARKRKYNNEPVAYNTRTKKVKSVTEQKVSQGNIKKLEEQGETNKLTALSHDCKPSTSKASRKTVGIADVAKTSRKIKDNNEPVAYNTNTKKVNSVTEPKVRQGNVKKLEEQGEPKKLTALSHDCKPSTSKSSQKTDFGWRASDLLAKMLNIKEDVSKNIITLLEGENTVPFIARYRQELTGNMDADKLREAKECYEDIVTLKHKAESVLKLISKKGQLTPQLQSTISLACTLEELDLIYAPYKESKKGTLAQRARQHGLEFIALKILDGTTEISHRMIHNLVNPNVEDLKTVHKVEQSICHILANIISKNGDVLKHLMDLIKRNEFSLETKERGNSKKASENSEKHIAEKSKYEKYFNFKASFSRIYSHDILAINRAESKKIITVHVDIPDILYSQLGLFVFGLFHLKGHNNTLRVTLITKSLEDAWDRLLSPFLVRQARAQLKKRSECDALKTFTSNLKHLLLLQPIKGRTILGIDPGYVNGCKLGLIDENGKVLYTGIIYPNFVYNRSPLETNDPAQFLKDLLNHHGCDLIALGNGTGSRKVEMYISDLIRSGWFSPLKVQYTIIDEQGSSSPLARKEFLSLDRKLISAVCLARRAQDPLGEYIKVDPKHLGVGMYQHDLKEKHLNEKLQTVIQECVSYVGVDINTASLELLKNVSGLNASKATNLIEWRSTNGPFMNRQQILKVKGIGKKSFEQCAGFVRIQLSQDSINYFKTKRDKEEENPLDRTWIHPETYSFAKRFIEMCGLDLKKIGTKEFIQRIEEYVQNHGMNELTGKLDIPIATLNLIVEGLKQPLNFDIRSINNVPIFKSEIYTYSNVKIGSTLTGQVKNVTTFGAFVDCGLELDALIPTKYMNTINMCVGDRAEVKVIRKVGCFENGSRIWLILELMKILK